MLTQAPIKPPASLYHPPEPCAQAHPGLRLRARRFLLGVLLGGGINLLPHSVQNGLQVLGSAHHGAGRGDKNVTLGLRHRAGVPSRALGQLWVQQRSAPK